MTWTPRADTRLLHSTALEKRFPDLVSLRNGGSTPPNVTAPASDLVENDFALLFGGTPAGGVGMYTVFGFTEIPEALEIEISVASGIVGLGLTWQYKSSDTFLGFSDLSGVTDGTANFANTGTCVVTWTPPMSWVLYTGNNLYEMRARVSSWTSDGTTPRGSWVYGHYTVAQDASQYETALSASGGAYYEDPSERAALDGTGAGRTIVISFETSTAGDGALVVFGDDLGDPAYELSTGSGDVFAIAGGDYLLDVAAPNIDGSSKTYLLAWATEPNPLTTGSSDALRSEFTLLDVDGNELLTTTVTHEVYAAGSTGALSIGGRWDGSTMSSVYNDTINEVAILSRFCSRPEIRERFVAQSAVPTVEGITAVEVPLLPSQVTEAGALAGPQYQFAAAAMQVGRNRHRLASPLIQMAVRSAPWIPLDPRDGWPDAWVYTMPDGFHTSIAWLWRRRVPTHLDWLLGSVHWATRDTGSDPVDCSLRLYCSDKLPPLNGQLSSATLTRTTDDDTGLGVFEDFDLVRVRRDAQGYSWIWLAGYTEETNNEYRVRGLTVVPVSKPANNNQPPNQWGP